MTHNPEDIERHVIMTKLCDMTAKKLRLMIGKKEISPVELLDSCIERIETIDSNLNAIVTKSYERARIEALKAEKAVRDGDELGLIHGLPIGIKDLESTAEIRTTLGSKLYENNIPKTDQGVIANIRTEGGVIVGKTNTPEFGAGANTRNLVFGATGNPFDPKKPVEAPPVARQSRLLPVWFRSRVALITVAA